MKDSAQEKSLLHFTGRGKSDEEAYSILKIILAECELLMSYSPTFSKEKFEKHFMMVCLTDPEKVDIDQHCSIFGKFAVSFRRKKMEEYGANPVLYVTPSNLSHIKNQINLLESFQDLNMDRDLKEEYEPYQFNEDELLSFYFITGLSQELKYKGEKDNYFQSEWRILNQPSRFLGQDSDDAPGMVRPGNINKKIVGYMRFLQEDVLKIHVPKNYVSRAKTDFPSLTIEVIPAREQGKI